VLDVTLDQRYQKVNGTVELGSIQGGLREARLYGTNITFAIVDAQGVRRSFTGQVDGRTMEGTVRSDTGAEARWTAVKR
jgi:hypothetical protein